MVVVAPPPLDRGRIHTHADDEAGQGDDDDDGGGREFVVEMVMPADWRAAWF